MDRRNWLDELETVVDKLHPVFSSDRAPQIDEFYGNRLLVALDDISKSRAPTPGTGKIGTLISSFSKQQFKTD